MKPCKEEGEREKMGGDEVRGEKVGGGWMIEGKLMRDGVRTLMKKALRNAAGSLNLYLLVTNTPPTTVAALLANVNCR